MLSAYHDTDLDLFWNLRPLFLSSMDIQMCCIFSKGLSFIQGVYHMLFLFQKEQYGTFNHSFRWGYLGLESLLFTLNFHFCSMLSFWTELSQERASCLQASPLHGRDTAFSLCLMNLPSNAELANSTHTCRSLSPGDGWDSFIALQNKRKNTRLFI